MGSIHSPILDQQTRQELKKSLQGVPEIVLDRQVAELDLLNRYDLAKVVWERLRGNDCPPAVGLYGSWGTGKTSLLNLIQFFNETYNGLNRTNVEIIPIEAWSYEGIGSLVAPIVTKLFGMLSENELRKPQFKQTFRKVMLVSGLMIGKTVLNVAGCHFLGINNIVNDIEETYDTVMDKDKPGSLANIVDTVKDAQDEFKNLVAAICRSKNCQRLAIFVDDLDRCSPENVVALLESVKNFFSVDGCVWVFAMDSGVVASYIDKKYDGTRMDGNSYLDKIIPEQYHIPSPFSLHDSARLETLLNNIFSQLGTAPTRWREYAKSPQVLVPRRLIKSACKFAEVYQLKSELASGADADTVFSLILLYHAWPKFYQYFTTDDERYIRGVLKHFALAQTAELFGNINVPLPGEFERNEDLLYFIQLAFLKNRQPGEDLVALGKQIVRAMAFLRQVGLP